MTNTLHLIRTRSLALLLVLIATVTLALAFSASSHTDSVTAGDTTNHPVNPRCSSC